MELNYRTFDDLLADVSIDFKNYAQNSMIEPAELIKVAKMINRSLGKKIMELKDGIMDISFRKGRLPLDFYSLESALVCTHHTVTTKVIQGDQREYKRIVGSNPIDKNSCEQECESTCLKPYTPCVQISECGNKYQIIETTKFETRTFTDFEDVSIERSKDVSKNCPNTRFRAHKTAKVKNGFVYTNFDTGVLYIKYLGSLVDEAGNLLVPDHDLLNPYYEYSLKRRILENLAINGEDVVGKINLIEPRYLKAKQVAESLISTPDFAELEMIYKGNRRHMNKRYYDPFK